MYKRQPVHRAAAGSQLVGGDIPRQLGVDVAQHPQAAVGVAPVVQGDRVAQPDAGGGEHLRGQAGARAHLPGLLDRGQRLAVEAEVGVGHREVVPAPGGLLIPLRDRGQGAGGLHQVGHATVQIALQVGAERGEGVHLAAQVGIRHLTDGLGGGGHRGGQLGHPAQVDQGAETLDQRVGPGGGVGADGQHGVQDRQGLCRAAVLLELTGPAQVLDMFRELVQPTHQAPPTASARRWATRPIPGVRDVS